MISLTSSRSAARTDHDRVGHHHLFQTDPGPAENQVTERDHPQELPFVADDVDIGEVLQFLVEWRMRSMASPAVSPSGSRATSVVMRPPAESGG